MDFYSKYAKLCTEKGLAPSRVASDLSISKNAVSNWKRGGRPTPENLLKIAEYFNVPVSYFDEGSRVEPFKPDFQLYAEDKSINQTLYETAQVRVLIDTFMKLDEIKKAKLLVYASELAQQ